MKKRINFDIPDELHRNLIMHLAPTRTKIKDFVTDLIKEKIRFEQNTNEEKRLPQS